MESVRLATDSDVADVVDLLTALGEHRARQRHGRRGLASDVAGRRPTDTSDEVRTYLDREDRRALVGLVDQCVVGICLCRTESAGDHHRGVIDACFVEPEARQVGVGEALVEAAVAWFDQRGVDGIDGTAHPGDRQAKQFLESAGFVARLIVMHRPLR